LQWYLLPQLLLLLLLAALVYGSSGPDISSTYGAAPPAAAVVADACCCCCCKWVPSCQQGAYFLDDGVMLHRGHSGHTAQHNAIEACQH
jgi:hypothetical protein